MVILMKKFIELPGESGRKHPRKLTLKLENGWVSKLGVFFGKGGKPPPAIFSGSQLAEMLTIGVVS